MLRPNEIPNLVGSFRLDAQYISTSLKGCKKMSHIEGDVPPRDDPKFEAWDDEDSLTMTGLWNFMTPKLSRNYMFYSSVREIWENLIEEPIALRKEKQSCIKYPISQFVCTDHLFVQHQSFIAAIDAIKTPTSGHKALKDESWLQAMKEEMEALEIEKFNLGDC
ncbi:hypothetical protein CR513_62127, partial [Mucuna pruriens]